MKVTIDIPEVVADLVLDSVAEGTGFDSKTGLTREAHLQKQVVRVVTGMVANGAMKKALADTKLAMEANPIT
jgi:hypothetical protein